MTDMKHYMTEKRKYERPTMRVEELQHSTMILAGSGTGTSGDPNYTPFNDEEEW